MTRWRSVAAALALAMLLVPAAAHAAGDRASDYFYTQSLFLPLEGSTPAACELQLRGLLAEAKAKGYPVRVAVIRTKADLGAVPSLFGRPDRYAPFLGQELRFLFKGPLLIVMPGGYGFYRLAHDTRPEERALAQLPPPSQAPDLARAAVPAVVALAALDGIALQPPALEGGSGSTWRDRLLIAAGALALGILVAAGMLWRRR
jgi:hypothetical protein